MHEKGGIPMNLRSIYKKYKRKKQLQTFAPYFSISPDTVLCDNFNLDLRAHYQKYLKNQILYDFFYHIL